MRDEEGRVRVEAWRGGVRGKECEVGSDLDPDPDPWKILYASPTLFQTQKLFFLVITYNT